MLPMNGSLVGLATEFIHMNSFILKITFLSPQLITPNCEHFSIPGIKLSEVVFKQAKGHPEDHRHYVSITAYRKRLITAFNFLHLTSCLVLGTRKLI